MITSSLWNNLTRDWSRMARNSGGGSNKEVMGTLKALQSQRKSSGIRMPSHTCYLTDGEEKMTCEKTCDTNRRKSK